MTIRPHGYSPHSAGTLSREQVVLNGKYAPAECANYSCYNPSGFLDSPFCDDCMWRLWAHVDTIFPEHQKQMAREGRIDAIHRQEAENEAREREAQESANRTERRTFMTMPGTIYYLMVGDLVKIGYSIDFEQRLKQYPPNVEVLATHPGTRETERQMHHKFLHRVAKGREWFTPCSEIDQHIEAVRSQFNAEAA